MNVQEHKVLPIELIMKIYEYSSPEEKAILNRRFKLKYKQFNPIKDIFKAKKKINRNIFNLLVDDIIFKNSNNEKIEIFEEIKSLRRKIRKQNDKIEIMMNILVNKGIIPKIDI